jgi:zinc transport system substrate-binding protein
MKHRHSLPAAVLITAITAAAFAAPLFAAGDSEKASDTEKLVAYGSIIPAQFLIERIGGERIKSGVVVLPGESPATYEPSPRQMTELSDAAVLFRIGVPFENGFLPKLERLVPDLRIVDLREGITLRIMDAAHSHDEDGDGHDAGHEEDAVGAPDPHLWMSPRNMITMAETINSTLSSLDPEGAAEYRENFNVLVSDLRDIDERLTGILEPYTGKRFFVYHPAFGYFADDYGLTQVPLEIEGKEPTGKQLAYYIDEAEELGVHIIFVQPEFPKNSAQTVAEAIGGTVIPINALSPDYLANLVKVAESLEKGLR